MPRAALYRLADLPPMTGDEVDEAPLRLAVEAHPSVQAEALAVVQAYCVAPHEISLLRRGEVRRADAVLLWWTPGMETPTMQVAREAHAMGVPLIALSGGGQRDDAAALEAGADAVCGLPVQPILIRSLITAYRRTSGASISPKSDSLPERASRVDDVLRGGPIVLSPSAHTCTVGGQALSLTLKEFDLLAYFLRRVGDCCSRDELLERVWGLDFDPGSNSVDVFVYTVRRKLKALGYTGIIQTVRGVGYRFVPPAAPHSA